MIRKHRRFAALMAAVLLAALGLTIAAASPTFLDVQANNPQVAGDAGSNATAVFPTNKQNEPTIAVNPTNPLLLIAGSNDEQRQPPCGPGPVRGTTAAANNCSFFPNVGTSGIYTSSDGGATWLNRGLLDDQASWSTLPIGKRLVSDGDPVIVYGPKPDSQGRFDYGNGVRAYYATLASYFDNAGSYPANKAPEYLAVSYSDDNGITWSPPVLATTKDNPNDFNDKESIWVDNLVSSPYFGRVYVSWTEFRSASSGSEPIMVAVSTNGGASFGAPKQLSPAGNNGTGNGRQGSALRSGPDGTVYVVWEQGFNQVVAVSRNGGGSWSRPAIVGPVKDIADPIPGANFRTDSFPSVAVSRIDGTVWVAWANRETAGGRMVVSSSTNKGNTWSAPAVVSGSEGYAFFQGLDVAPNGRVDLAYQVLNATNSASYGTGNARIDTWYVSKPVAGAWTSPAKVNSVTSDPAASAQNNLQRQFWGDYSTLVSTNAKAFFIGTDSRDGVGCPAVDAYQRFLDGTPALRRGDMADRIAARLGQDPAVEPGAKPAPPADCPPSGTKRFGNTDVWVSVITP